MRVVYFCQYFVTPNMNGSTRAYEFSKRLVGDGHHVHVITSDRKGGARRQEIIDGINITWIPVRYANSMSPVRRTWAFVVFALFAAFVGIKTRPTVIFASSTPLTVVIPALLTKLLRRAPMVFEVRDLWPEMPIAIGALSNPVLIHCARRLEKLAYNSSCKVIALSPGMRDGIVATGYPEDCVVVIPNSSDIAQFNLDPQVGKDWLASQDWYRGGPVVLYAGTFGQVNGLEYLVDVAAETYLTYPDLQFLVVGGGRYWDSIRERARQKGVLDVNFHLGHAVPKCEVPFLFSAATVITSIVADVPHIENNSANKVFDGLAAGKPVAINYGGWQQELLEEWQCGLRISRDPRIAARELVAFVQDEEALQQAGVNALRLATDQFDRDKLYSSFGEALASCEAG